MGGRRFECRVWCVSIKLLKKKCAFRLYPPIIEEKIAAHP
jgi:hypothetical protein